MEADETHFADASGDAGKFAILFFKHFLFLTFVIMFLLLLTNFINFIILNIGRWRYIMKNEFPLFFFLIFAFFQLEYAIAEEFEPNCLSSFDVKNTIIDVSGEAISCVFLEKEKTKIFVSYRDFIEGADIASLRSDIDRLQSVLAKAESSADWASFMVGVNVLGNAVTTIGLSACLETVGIGCGGAAIGAIIAKLSIIDSGGTLSEKQQASASIRVKLVKAQQIYEKNSGQLSTAKQNLATEFNRICKVIETRCM